MISFPFSQRLSVFHCLHRSWWSLQYSAVVMRGGISENIYNLHIMQLCYLYPVETTKQRDTEGFRER